ncbi:Casein kinase II subunit alpha' [Sporothrix epigloea]|uniref:Casein kinase II subunit alpha n=1 Tax=Sporothrix epigloea TaxID=1892477 RepID=A0ABP0DXD1_9PEZI
MTTPESIRVPQVTREELFAFHESHFSQSSVTKFCTTFMGLSGPKIAAISGLSSRDQDKLPLFVERNGNVTESIDESFLLSGLNDRSAEKSEISPADDENGLASAAATNLIDDRDGQEQRRKKRRRKKNNTGNSCARRLGKKKPDLRKRTWDIVDSGLGSLDYDGSEPSAESTQSAPLRRRVQYGDN